MQVHIAQVHRTIQESVWSEERTVIYGGRFVLHVHLLLHVSNSASAYTTKTYRSRAIGPKMEQPVRQNDIHLLAHELKAFPIPRLFPLTPEVLYLYHIE